MKSDSFCKLSCKPCWEFDDWIQMISSTQIGRLYRVSEGPKTGQKGHNQAWKAKTRPKGTKGDKRAISNHVSVSKAEGFDWLESTDLAIDKRKFLLNRLYQKQPIPQDEDQSNYECYRIIFSWTFALLRFNKNCKQPNFKSVLLLTWK